MQSIAYQNGGVSETIAQFLKRSRPRTYRAMWDIVFHGWFRIALAVAVYSLFPNIWTFLFAFFGVASGMGSLVALSHESQHGALLRNKKWNDLIGAWFLAYPVGSIWGSSRAVHLAHHRLLNTPGDPDRHFHIEDDKSTPGQFARYFLWLLLGGQLWTSFVVNGFLRARQGPDMGDADKSPGSGVIAMPKRDYPEVFNLLPVQALIFLTLWLVSGKWWLYFALWLGPIFTLGTFLGYLRGFIDHARLENDDAGRAGGRLITVPEPSLFDRMFLTGLDFHFHAEHHFFPSVPHYYLPELHKLLQADPQFRDRYLLRRSYGGFLKEYWQQISRKRTADATGPAEQAGTRDASAPPVESCNERETAAQQQTKRPSVLFIQPKLPPSFWGMEFTAPYAGFKYPNPPLGILTLAGAISPQYHVEIRDENVGDVCFPTEAEIVGISGTLLHEFHVGRLIEIARYFREQGKTVCVGGPVANLSPQVVRPHCDVLFEGEGEYTWPRFLEEYQRGEHKDFYQQVEKVDMLRAPVPRIDLVNATDYGAGQIQTTRGCPFTCEFCDIIVMYGRKVRAKPIDIVLKEVQIWADAGQELIFFSDDNFVGNRPYAKQLLRALIEFNSMRKNPIYFYTQASIDTAKDRELMELMRDANFAGMFIGIESPRKASLSETHKVQNVHTEDLAEAIHTIQSYGLFVSGGMILGFDSDDKDIFDEQFDFLQRSGIPFAQLSLLEAMPKTPLWDRMKESGRLLEYREGLQTNIQPLNMTYQELVNGYTKLIQRLYCSEAYAARYLGSLERMRKHTFPLDRPRKRWTNLINLARIFGYYLCSLDLERHRFFWKMMIGTMRLQPRAWRWTARYLANFIHFSQYAQRYVMVVLAPMTGTEPVIEPRAVRRAS